jgi:hypothetical protein
MRFTSKWEGTVDGFPCFYNPEAPHVVVMEKMAFTVVFHAILWPCLCLGCGILLWVGLCVGWWRLDPTLEYEQYQGL